jgi:hypothetical protein
LASDATMALRAVGLEYQDPFNRKPVRITAPSDAFVEKFMNPAPASAAKKSPSAR